MFDHGLTPLLSDCALLLDAGPKPTKGGAHDFTQRATGRRGFVNVVHRRGSESPFPVSKIGPNQICSLVIEGRDLIFPSQNAQLDNVVERRTLIDLWLRRESPYEEVLHCVHRGVMDGVQEIRSICVFLGLVKKLTELSGPVAEKLAWNEEMLALFFRVFSIHHQFDRRTLTPSVELLV
ncbi:uncharacterized protein HMPREF1120_05047 [Exophiala dermatitidis NIH/UT8656]|uniref:Uncharacterized protein n=1 Tax=Exophiala dermatitidis (strain ATCC 34100 / CBS 525.76 / NIH/UT8656) TaxID=858893 RepID=H6BZC9_EXODN|nr:uncharacterized protein HMPREF1120_05047 [Exophiala dermatitidis NIH/UT8656]EHY56991.1 hypothetical protein HMPREF1120_05047 [Exophiala dermatitidis NIH/UT8656]